MVPDEDTRGQQKSWDYPVAERKRDRLLLDANQFDRARILGAATPESGAWLRALPAASLGTHLDNETVRIAVALRIGADVCSGVTHAGAVRQRTSRDTTPSPVSSVLEDYLATQH